MWWFVPALVIIGALVYFTLLEMEHARTERVTRALMIELRRRDQ